MISFLARFHKVFYIFLFSFITIFCWKIISLIWWITGILPSEAPLFFTLLCGLALTISVGLFVFVIAPGMVHKIIDISNNPKNLEAEKISELGRNLYTKEIGIPIVDIYFNFEATFRLIKNGSPEAVRGLAYAISLDVDKEVRKIILGTLQKITDKSCIDIICQIWSNTRHQDLADLIVKKGWTASYPRSVKVLTALKAKKIEIITNSSQEIVEPLLKAFEDEDIEIANRASECAILFDNPKCQKLLLDLIIEQDHPIARQIAIKAKYAPSEPSRRALFYFLTEQWNEYENLDFDYSLLQQAYELPNKVLRKKIAKKAKETGRIEWVQVVAGGIKDNRLGEMSDAEWETMINIFNSNKQWEKMWQLAQKAPTVWSKELVQILKKVKWLPTVKEEQKNFKRLENLSAQCGKKEDLAHHENALVAHRRGLGAIGFSPNGRLLASGGFEGVKLWQMPNGGLLTTLNDHSDCVSSISFSPDGCLLASCDYSGIVKLWRMPDGQLLNTLNDHSDGVMQVSFSPDGRLLAGCNDSRNMCRDPKIKLWRMPDGQLLTTLIESFNLFYGVSFSPDGQLLATNGTNNIHEQIIKLRKVRQILDGNKIVTHTFKARDSSFSPDGQLLACGGIEGIELWRMPDGQKLTTLTEPDYFVDRVCFSPDGQLLASRCSDGIVKLWRTHDDRLITTLNNHSDFVIDLSFSPDGRILVSRSSDGTVKLWQMPDGQLITTFTDHSHSVEGVRFSPDGQILVSDHDQGIIKLWSTELLDLPRLMRIPIKQLCQQKREDIEKALQNQKITEQERHWYKFMQELINWHQRFDVEVEDAPQLVSTNEFDIEIEE